MTAPQQLTAFAAALLAVFAVATGAGHVLEPSAPGGEASAHRSAMTGMAADPVRGLAVAEHGLRLALQTPQLRRGVSQQLRFRILDSRAKAIRDFDVEHTKRMHLIVVRRDLTGFQHLHPAMSADGTWSMQLRLRDPGSYRVFADFSHEGEATTLAADVRVDGSADLQPLPAPRARALSDGGLNVRLHTGAVRAGGEAELSFTVTRGTRPVHTEPYLGAGGHLVALRDGDLAFLHVHPGEQGHQSAPGAISFAVAFPTAGAYRLFLQFQVAGRVQTVAFTEAVMSS